jgi:hypothetical protein
MTNEQEIRAAAAAIILGPLAQSGDLEIESFIQDNGKTDWEIGLNFREPLRAVERYIRDGL